MSRARYYPRVKESFFVRKNDTVFGFDIVISEGSDILDVINFLRESGFSILHFDWSGEVGHETGIFIVVDLAEKNPKEIVDELKSISKSILSVSLSPIVVGKLIYSNILFPISVSDMRGILLTQGVTGGMLKVFKEHFGEDMSASILYHSGFAIGKELYSFFIKPLNPKTIADTIEIFKAHMITTGIGIIQEYSLSKDEEIIVDIGDLWECDFLRDKVDKPASNLFRGIFNGVLSSALNKELVVKETRCIAIGDRFCRFKFTQVT